MMSFLEQAVDELATELTVRNLRERDVLPQKLQLGFQQVDGDWAWVVVIHGDVVACLLAAPCHGMVFLVRLTVLPEFGWVLPRLFRCFVRTAQGRGYVGYFTYLDPRRYEEKKLHSILTRAGGKSVKQPQHCVGGKLADLGKW